MGKRYKYYIIVTVVYTFIYYVQLLHAIDLLDITIVIQYAKFFPLSIVGILPM